MNAITLSEFGGTELLKYGQVEKPKMGKGEILIKVKAIGVNPIDTYIRSGIAGFMNPVLPLIPGQDFSGVIEESSPETSLEYPVGTNVFVCKNLRYGAYAEYATAIPGSDIVGKMPSSMTFEQGASIGIPYLTAACALKKMGETKPGQTVLVHGASGGVGMAACNIAASMGCTVFATVGTELGAKNAKDAGADKIFYHNSADYVDQIIKAAESNNGIDVVIENSGHTSLNNSITVTKADGHIVIVGAKDFHNTNLQLILVKQLVVRGIFLYGNPLEELQSYAQYIAEMSEKNQLKVNCVSYSLKDAGAAQDEVSKPSKGGARGKVILTI